MNIKSIVVLFVILYTCIHIWEKERTDKIHPFGGDNRKLKIYLDKSKLSVKNFPKGEDYGVQTYWGKPNKKDTVKQALDKIEWIGTNYNSEIIWRRCLVYAIIFGLLSIIIGEINFKPDKILSIIFLLFIGFYMTKSYEKAHIQKIKSKFISQNIGIIKNKLDLSHENSIINNPLI
jgi:hypothetical protein